MSHPTRPQASSVRRTNTEVPPDLLERFRAAKQDHVFRFWGALDPEGRAALEAQLRALDLERVRSLALGEGVESKAASEASLDPAEVIRLGEGGSFGSRAQAEREGRRLLAEGKVGIFLVAGGQGSRLGFEGPKGCLPSAPLSSKTIFQFHAEKIRALSVRARKPVPWYILTSEANDAATKSYFEGEGYFGLGRENVSFCVQDMLPALDSKGKLILESKGGIFRSPNGHGGAYEAFRSSGALEDARARGLEYLFYFQVDNILIRLADPVFLGFHALAGAEMSSKVLRKTGPEEKIGVVVREGDRCRVIEYSDMPVRESERRDRHGDLVHWAGSIAIHVFGLDFFASVASGGFQLPYHLARKKIPSLDAEGKPTQVEGCKFETFVFDALPHAKRFVNLEVRREEEFAPIKNRTGVDSLESAREMLLAEHARWCREAALEVEGRVEVSPLLALDPEDLRAKLAPATRKTWRGDVRIEPGPDGMARIEPVGAP